MATQTPPTPTGLTRRARRLFKAVVAEYELTPSQLELFILACREFSTSENCDKLIQNDGLTVQDRFGQTQPHPLLSQSRNAKANALKLLRSIGLTEIQPEEN